MPYCEAIIIGAGQSGPFPAGRLTGAGVKVAIVERRLFGGTCVNTGCLPTKAMISSARAAHLSRWPGDCGGVIDGPINIDMKAVKARRDAISERSGTGLTTWLKEKQNCTAYQGHPRFEWPTKIRVGSELLNSELTVAELLPAIPGELKPLAALATSATQVRG